MKKKIVTKNVISRIILIISFNVFINYSYSQFDTSGLYNRKNFSNELENLVHIKGLYCKKFQNIVDSNWLLTECYADSLYSMIVLRKYNRINSPETFVILYGTDREIISSGVEKNGERIGWWKNFVNKELYREEFYKNGLKFQQKEYKKGKLISLLNQDHFFRIRLHNAIIEKDINAVRRELAWGADVNSENERGEDATYFATIHFNKSILELILKNVKNVNKTYHNKYSLLHFAMIDDNATSIECTMVLLKHNIDINQKDIEGNIPLWYACRKVPPNLELIKILLHAGSDINVKNKNGKNIKWLMHEKKIMGL